MSGVFWALFGPLFYLGFGVLYAYVATLIAMRSPSWDSGYVNTWGPGSILALSIFWPLTILVLVPVIGIVAAQRKQDKRRLRESEIRKIEAEVFGK